MLRWGKIVCPVDLSEVSMSALKLAASVAAQFESSLIIMNVVEPIVAPSDFTFGPMTTGEVEDRLVERSTQALKELAATLQVPAGKVSARVERGRASSEIVRVAQEEKADLIVIGTHGYTGMAHVLLGSTAERVIRKAPCPVLTVRAPDLANEG
jgi:universal stress protein A